jgi:hypothetical protein
MRRLWLDQGGRVFVPKTRLLFELHRASNVRLRRAPRDQRPAARAEPTVGAGLEHLPSPQGLAPLIQSTKDLTAAAGRRDARGASVYVIAGTA